MIGKVLRGKRVDGLMYYLYGPGRANEHVNPHLVAGWRHPAELEPRLWPDGRRDFRHLNGLLKQPLAALDTDGYGQPVWHCVARAAGEDRVLTDEEWARVAHEIMDRTGLARPDDAEGVRWVAVRHADDHIHIVATLARQDGTKPRTWNDFYRVREACQAVERRFGLRVTAPGDRTAARRPKRAETEKAARQGWTETPRIVLRRRVITAAGGAGSEEEFFRRLQGAGVRVRRRFSDRDPGQVTGYAVALRGHTTRQGAPVWYGGGRLASDLSLPKLRARWNGGGTTGRSSGQVPAATAKVLLRTAVRLAAHNAGSPEVFFGRLRSQGVLVRRRFSEQDPGEVTGYAVALAGSPGRDGPVWFGGGRLADDLTLPRLRTRWRRRPDTMAPSGPAQASTTKQLLRTAVRDAARDAGSHEVFFARLRAQGLLVRERLNEHDPGQVTGYAVALADCPGRDGRPVWFGGGRLGDDLTLPRLRAAWTGRTSGFEEQDVDRGQRRAIYDDAAAVAREAADWIRHITPIDPSAAADAAWAASDALHVAAAMLDDRMLRRAADAFDRAAREPYARVPRPTPLGHGLRNAARLMALTGPAGGDNGRAARALIVNLGLTVAAVAELRQAQRRIGSVAGARTAAAHLVSAQRVASRDSGAGYGPAAATLAGADFPGVPAPGTPRARPTRWASPQRPESPRARRPRR